MKKQLTTQQATDLHSLKGEFRLFCDNTFEDANDAWMEAVGQMKLRGMYVPVEWKYEAGIGEVVERDSPLYESLCEVEDDVILVFANLMFRYLRFLNYLGLSPDKLEIE